jgi:hypothetical protein
MSGGQGEKNLRRVEGLASDNAAKASKAAAGARGKKAKAKRGRRRGTVG